MYQLMVERDGQLFDCSWAPRSYKSARVLYHYYTRTWPNNSYWLRLVG